MAIKIVETHLAVPGEYNCNLRYLLVEPILDCWRQLMISDINEVKLRLSDSFGVFVSTEVAANMVFSGGYLWQHKSPRNVPFSGDKFGASVATEVETKDNF
ncbi:hypothetical protein HAX54_030778 [Datura stramonium]|uniref:Uncharacterized protein n=1 Tax=Datura stramonium TaxID=4076 RepID=A0ABS8SBG2_DATST|nr:hypothetical protein [Datura stramonium]